MCLHSLKSVLPPVDTSTVPRQNRTRRARRGTPPPVFCQKRLQTIENKELEPRKERQEIPRGGKLMKGQGLSRRPTWMRGTIG